MHTKPSESGWRMPEYDGAAVEVSETPEQLGRSVADAFARAVRAALATKDDVSVILATGNSQLPFIAALQERNDIEWSRVNVFHMDEYRGMSDQHPASFRLWMNRRVVDTFHPRRFFGIDGDHEPIEEEIARYSSLLESLRPEICVMGIGENGHLAFNDPPADFDTAELAHVVQLDDACKRQQTGEGHFASIADVPDEALSLTVPALLAPATVLIGVPDRRKAEAVRNAFEGPIDPSCPASILQRSPNATVFLDAESASLLDRIPVRGSNHGAAAKENR